MLAVPGAGIVSNAFAADGGSGSSSTQQQAPASGDATPVQTQDDGTQDRRDCPKEDGGSGQSGTSADTAL